MPAVAVLTRNLISIDEAAEYLGVHPRTIRNYIASGALPAFRTAGGRTIRVRRTDLDASLTPVTSVVKYA